MSKKVIQVMFLFLVATNVLKAQDSWNLSQCISYAIKNNIGLKKMEIGEKIAGENFRQSQRNFLPGISASTGSGFSFGRSIDPVTNGVINTQFFNNSYNLGASMTLFNGFMTINQIEYQKYIKRTAELNRLNATDDLAFQVMNSYFDVLYFQGILEIAENQVEASGINLKRVEKQVELGMKSNTDLFEMRANYETEELKRIQAKNSLRTANLQLRQQMNLSDTAMLVLVDEQNQVIPGQTPDQQDLFASYIGWSPYFQSFQSQLNASRKYLSISRSQLYPSITVSGSVNTGYSGTNRDNSDNVIGFKDQFNSNLSQYVGASVNIPIFNKWNKRSEIKKAKFEIERAKNTLDEEKQKLYFEMVNNLNELEALENEYNQYLRQLEADSLAYQASEKKLAQGFVSVVEFYIAKNRLANTESQVIKARLQWEVKKRVLDFYSGERFWE